MDLKIGLAGLHLGQLGHRSRKMIQIISASTYTDKKKTLPGGLTFTLELKTPIRELEDSMSFAESISKTVPIVLTLSKVVFVALDS